MRIYSATDVGQKRKMNQDYVFVSEGPVGNLPNLFTVADGMGGHNAGDYASSHAVRILVDEIREDADYNPVKVIRHAIETAGRRKPPGHGNHYGSGDYCRSVCLCGQCR